MKSPLVITFYLIFLISTSWASDTDEIFFHKHYELINQNISKGKYEANLILIDQLIKQNEYKDLDCYYQGKILHKVGVSYYKLNKESEAISYFKNKVLSVWKDCSQVPPSEKANTIYNIGISYQFSNNLEAAKLYIDKALYIFENDPQYPTLKLASKYHGIGRFYQSVNDSFRASLYFRNAINLYKEEKDSKAKEFEVFNDLIAMSMEFKEYKKAKSYVKQALKIQSDFPEMIPTLNLAWVYLNAGSTYLGLQEYEMAHKMAMKSLNLLDEKTDAFYYSIGLELIAMIMADQSKFILAENNMNEVILIRKKLYQEGENQDAMARAYENLSDILIRKNQLKNADLYVNKAFNILFPYANFDTNHLPIIKTSKSLDDRHLIRLIELKIRIFEAKYKDTKNLSFLKKALHTQHKIDSVINRSLVSFQFEQSKLDFLNLKFEHYGKAVEDALQLHQITKDQFYLEEAYYFSSKTKAIVLQYELNQSDAFKSNVSKEILNKEKVLRESMQMEQTRLIQTHSTNRDSLLKTYTKAQYELDTFLKKIEKQEPSYFKEKYAFIKPPNVKDIQRNLPKDMVVIEYFLSENTIFSFWITRKKLIPIMIPYDQTIKKALDNFIAQCHDPGKKISKELSNLIVEKCLKKGLKIINNNIKRICIIPDGQLHQLSFEALPTIKKNSGEYLIEEYAISYSYSISQLFRKKRSTSLKKYIGFGSKYSHTFNEKLRVRKQFFGDINLMQLTLSQKEIKRGSAIFDGEVFLDSEASLNNFLKHSPDADIIHLSLHGLVDINDPARSCILFDDHHNEFILSTQNLYLNRLQADIVLLSACHSASGKIYSGEGVQGMSKSFLLSGAHNILSSLWNATEASSMVITTLFLENVHAGQPNDLALHQSKLDYLSNIEPNKKHPYYWANFILLGEIDQSKESTNLTIYVLAPILLLVLSFVLYKYRKPGNKS
ncbi:CHAT domain-containing protein [Aquimarina sp. AD10]|uniref:CHAT domain-containing protein n=1 Tax=Aquimarina sp. AD10 TaxID=1714849 RepID=UPI001F2E483D|nr:CHAT domain-containing protein [Aquimarina sp. AD10]